MSIFQVKAHEVTAIRIEQVDPLIVGGDKLLSPDIGIMLRLDDGTKRKWMSEPNVPTPVQGDWLVQDEVLATTFVVTAARFAELFGEMA